MGGTALLRLGTQHSLLPTEQHDMDIYLYDQRVSLFTSAPIPTASNTYNNNYNKNTPNSCWGTEIVELLTAMNEQKRPRNLRCWLRSLVSK